MQRALICGTLKASAGALVVCGSAWIGEELLASWGWALFAIAFALIAWGLIPYRKLKWADEHPTTLIAQSDAILIFSPKGKVRIPTPEVVAICYHMSRDGEMLLIALRDGRELSVPHFNERVLQ